MQQHAKAVYACSLASRTNTIANCYMQLEIGSFQMITAGNFAYVTLVTLLQDFTDSTDTHVNAKPGMTIGTRGPCVYHTCK